MCLTLVCSPDVLTMTGVDKTYILDEGLTVTGVGEGLSTVPHLGSLVSLVSSHDCKTSTCFKYFKLSGCNTLYNETSFKNVN